MTAPTRLACCAAGSRRASASPLRIPRARRLHLRVPAGAAGALQRAERQRDGDGVGTGGGTVKFAQFYTPSIGIFGLTTACYTTRDHRHRHRPRHRAAQARPRHPAADADLPRRLADRRGADRHPRRDADVRRRRPRVRRARLRRHAAGGGRHARCSARPAWPSLGLAVATLAKTADQATPVAQLTFLPLSFISGIWFPLDGAPDWLTTIAHIFPLYHIVRAFDRCFSPGVSRRRVVAERPLGDRALDRRRPVRRDAAVPGRARACRTPARAAAACAARPPEPRPHLPRYRERHRRRRPGARACKRDSFRPRVIRPRRPRGDTDDERERDNRPR